MIYNYNMKKLYRSEKNKIFAGVIGGLGEYFNIDPVVLRVLWVLMVVFTGIIPGVVVYIIAAMLIPDKHGKYHYKKYCKKEDECKCYCEHNEKYKDHD